jgi:hypothetical protein
MKTMMTVTLWRIPGSVGDEGPPGGKGRAKHAITHEEQLNGKPTGLTNLGITVK